MVKVICNFSQPRLSRLGMAFGAWLAASSIIIGVLATSNVSYAQESAIVKTDLQIDALDPGIKLFLREKMPQGSIGLELAATSSRPALRR